MSEQLIIYPTSDEEQGPGVSKSLPAYEKVDDPWDSPDNASTTIGAATPSQLSYYLFGLDSIVLAGILINKITTHFRIRTSNPTNQWTPYFKINGSYYAGTGRGTSDVWQSFTESFSVNPDTGVAWTLNDINNMWFGLRVGASAGNCTQVYLVMDYDIPSGGGAILL